MKFKYFLLCLMIYLPVFTFAHPGHGVLPADHAGHYLISPVHVIPAALLFAMIVIFRVRKKRMVSKAP